MIQFGAIQLRVMDIARPRQQRQHSELNMEPVMQMAPRTPTHALQMKAILAKPTKAAKIFANATLIVKLLRW
jgi:hypothetical protein